MHTGMARAPHLRLANRAPFFESRGYSVVRENIAVRRGIELKNFLMEKPLT